MMSLPPEILRAAQTPAINRSMALTGAIRKALQELPGAEAVEAKHEGGCWSVSLIFHRELYRIEIGMECEFVEAEDPNPYSGEAA